jgi:hypothetical protein
VCVPKCRVVGQPVFPWRQSTPYGDEIARVKFSLPERLLFSLANRTFLTGFSIVFPQVITMQ